MAILNRDIAVLVNIVDVDSLGGSSLANLNVHAVAAAQRDVAGTSQLPALGNFLQHRSVEGGLTLIELELLTANNIAGVALFNVADIDGLSLRGLIFNRSVVDHAIGSILHVSKSQLIASFQIFRAVIALPIVVAFRQFRSFNLVSGSGKSFLGIDFIPVIAASIALELNINATICKRCKRHAHDNHEHSSQQSQQTSFKRRFLHVISPIH